MSDNAKLIAKARDFATPRMVGKPRFQDLDQGIELVRRLTDALEAAEAAKLGMKTEWSCAMSEIYGTLRPLGSRDEAMQHAKHCIGSIQEREVTEWRRISTEEEEK